jgi:hypothetical protein
MAAIAFREFGWGSGLLAIEETGLTRFLLEIPHRSDSAGAASELRNFTVQRDPRGVKTISSAIRHADVSRKPDVWAALETLSKLFDSRLGMY